MPRWFKLALFLVGVAGAWPYFPANAEDSGQGASFADEDKDTDGLTNGEEALYNTDLDNPNTDGDDKGDAEDGWAGDKDDSESNTEQGKLDPSRLPKPSYAAIVASKIPNSYKIWYVNGKGQAVVNDDPNDAYDHFYFWEKGATQGTPIPIPAPPQNNPLSSNGNIWGLSENGTVVGTLYESDNKVKNSPRGRGWWWRSGSALTRLPENPLPRDYQEYAVYPFLIVGADGAERIYASCNGLEYVSVTEPTPQGNTEGYNRIYSSVLEWDDLGAAPGYYSEEQSDVLDNNQGLDYVLNITQINSSGPIKVFGLKGVSATGTGMGERTLLNKYSVKVKSTLFGEATYETTSDRQWQTGTFPPDTKRWDDIAKTVVPNAHESYIKEGSTVTYLSGPDALNGIEGTPGMITSQGMVLGMQKTTNAPMVWAKKGGTYTPFMLKVKEPDGYLNSRFEIAGGEKGASVAGVSAPSIWRNYHSFPLLDVFSGLKDYSKLSVWGIDDQGIIQTVATLAKDASKQQILLLVPIEHAPDVLKVNSNFDEQKIDTTTHYAKPDNGDDDLKAERGDKHGKIITDDLHKGFWGVNPNTFPPEFYTGATVTITKKPETDEETDLPEKGTIRLYAIKKLGETDEQSYAIPISDTDTPTVSSDTPKNLVNGLYGPSAPTPRGDDVTYWMEGVDPGPITLEFKYVKGNLTFTHEQKFKVVTQQTKEAWQKEVRDQILLESQGAVDMNQFDPTASFTTNIKFIKSVYGYYEQLYAKYPDEFLWAGMAKMAGAPVFAGLSDAQYLRDHVPSDIVGALVQFFTANLAEFQHQLMLANKLIYDDLAWQHRAYVGSGILALKYVDDKDQSSGVRKVDIQSWNRIDEGIEDGAEPSPNVIEGNKTLLQREQRDVVQDVYNTLEGLRATWLSYFFPVSYNDALSMFAVNPIPGGMDFQLFNPDGNIGVFADRWDWIAGDDYEGMYQIWSGVSPSKGYDSDRRTDKVKISLSTRAKDYADFPNSVP